eukprot:750928-Hanusia_phi.AAC.5
MLNRPVLRILVELKVYQQEKKDLPRWLLEAKRSRFRFPIIQGGKHQMGGVGCKHSFRVIGTEQRKHQVACARWTVQRWNGWEGGCLRGERVKGGGEGGSEHID